MRKQPIQSMDEEIRAIRKNAALMAPIDRLTERARKGPTKSLEEIKAKYGIKSKRDSQTTKRKR